MVLGPAGDLISIAGSVNNLVANPNSAEYWVDAAVSLIGFVPIAGDLNALVSYVFNTSCLIARLYLNY